jgi:hypothetical protein
MAIPSARLISENGDEEDVMHWTTVDSVFPWKLRPGANEIYSAVDNPELSPIIKIIWYVPEKGI